MKRNAAEESRHSSPVAAARSAPSLVAGARGTAEMRAATGDLCFQTLCVGLKFIPHLGCDLILVAALSLDANGLLCPILHIL